MMSSGVGGDGGNEDYIEQQLNNVEKLKETIEQMKSSNKHMSQMAMNIFVK